MICTSSSSRVLEVLEAMACRTLKATLAIIFSITGCANIRARTAHKAAVSNDRIGVSNRIGLAQEQHTLGFSAACEASEDFTTCFVPAEELIGGLAVLTCVQLA